MDRRSLGLFLGIPILVLLIFAVATPNLLRSRQAANESARVGKLRTQREQNRAHLIDVNLQDGNADTITGASLSASKSAAFPDQKKLIQACSLELLVKDVGESVATVQKLTGELGGEVEKADVNGTRSYTRGGEIVLRVPADRIDEAIATFRKSAIQVQSEHREARDITREYTDSEARLRNLKAEEEQYLALLKRAGSMKDTLEATEKISEVRGQIEHLQGELNWWTHQVEMSAIQISLTEEPRATEAARWRPLYNAQQNVQEMVQGLGEWLDCVVAFIIRLPLILLWVFSVGGALWLAWKSARFVWLRWLKPKPSPEAHATT